MAGIDKIHCHSKRDFLEFYEWCDKFKDLCLKETQLDIMSYFYDFTKTCDANLTWWSFGLPITNFPIAIDKWLAKHCPIKWVRDNYEYIGRGCKRKEIELYLDKE